jgi:hypothetical protein
VFPVGIGLRDPRSQKRDLGHPSIFLFRLASASRLLGMRGSLRLLPTVRYDLLRTISS